MYSVAILILVGDKFIMRIYILVCKSVLHKLGYGLISVKSCLQKSTAEMSLQISFRYTSTTRESGPFS